MKIIYIVTLTLLFIIVDVQVSESQTNDFSLTSAKVVRVISDSVSAKIKSDSIISQLQVVQKKIIEASLKGENYVKIVRNNMLEDKVIEELISKAYYVTGTSYNRNISVNPNKYIWVYSYYIGW